MEKAFEVIARGVCIVEGSLLLCHGRDQTNTYLPGGHIERGESAAVALEREILEELGVASQAGGFMGAVENHFTQSDEEVYEINLIFRLAIPGLAPGEAVPVEEPWLDFRWVSLDRIEEAQLQPSCLIKMLQDLPTEDGEGVLGWGSNYL
ncbi:MAG: NUDIX domain-containing protein [Lentisphaerae bacterium]|nr:NUDIX domain-containing protein [Lentisphaerota bacterium]